MVPPGRWFIRKLSFALKFLSGYEHRGTLPQSRIRSTAPSEREPGRGCAIHPTARKAEGFGRFSSPLRKLKSFYISPFIGRHSLREGAGERSHSTGCLRNRGGAGDFHRPYEGSEVFTFYHSSGDTPSVTPVGRDSSLREGAGERSHSTGYSLISGVTGDFHRPYETQKVLHFTIQPPPVSDAKTIPGGAGHSRMGTRPVRN